MARRKVATWAVILCALAAAGSMSFMIYAVAVPAARADNLSNGGTTPATAAAAEEEPEDNLSNDETTPPPPPAPEPGPEEFDNLSNDETTPPPPPAPEPGPGVLDELTNENEPPSPPAPPPPPPAAPPTPAAPPAPAGTPSPALALRPPSVGGAPARPTSRKAARTSVSLRTSSRITRRRLRKGLALRLTASAPAHVVVTLRGPGRSVTRRTLTLGKGTRKLTLKPRHAAGRGRKVIVTVTGAGADGTRINLTRRVALR